jgi:membrane AbrB-like protein
MALALLIGAAGGFLAFAAGMPLPWMLGALFASMAAALAGLPVVPPNRIRPATVAVIGVLLGARFTPDVIGAMGQWAVSLGLLTVYMIAVAGVTGPFYRYFGKADWQTAYLSGLPGGLSEMVELGEEKGADVRTIILAHTLRIVVTIALIAVWFRVIEGRNVGSMPNFGGAPLTLLDAAMLLVCAVAGSIGGKWLKLPAPTFLGPMFLSAILHATEMTASSPPTPLVIAAQIILGTVLGCRFLGTPVGTLLPALRLSLGATGATLLIALVFAGLMHAVIGITLDQGILALAPGGLTEMGLIALAINADVAFVALHHVVRILLVLLLAKPLFALMPKGQKSRSA